MAPQQQQKQQQHEEYERQQRMLCGKHAFNAILPDSRTSQAELDALALRAAQEEAAVQGETKVRFAVKLAHRWPLLGNYSVRVLQLAAAARDLDLEYVQPDRLTEELEQLVGASPPSPESSAAASASPTQLGDAPGAAAPGDDSPESHASAGPGQGEALAGQSNGAEASGTGQEALGLLCNMRLPRLLGLVQSRHWFAVKVDRAAGGLLVVDSRFARPSPVASVPDLAADLADRQVTVLAMRRRPGPS